MTGVLILCGIVVLVYAPVRGWPDMALGPRIVLMIFTVVFVNIFRDFVKDARKAKRARTRKANGDPQTSAARAPAGHVGRDAANEGTSAAAPRERAR